MLHLVSQQRADVPVVLTDTGYLFPETYRFIDRLTERSRSKPQGLPGRTLPAGKKPPRQTVGAGRRGIEQLQPAQQGGAHGPALAELGAAQTWFSGPAP